MTRGRAKTIVQRIASDVPSLKDDVVSISSAIDELNRSSSLSTKRSGLNASNGSPLYPFNGLEIDEMWETSLNKFNYNCLLDKDDIEIVNQQDLDSILNFKDNCAMNRLQINTLITQTDLLILSVDQLQLKYDKISNQTLEFDRESNKLMSLQNGYVEKFSQIESYLKNFETLEPIMKSLSRSGYSLIIKKFDHFKFDILAQLDDSLAFFADHPTIKNIDMYSRRYRQCMTKALTLIKTYLMNEISKLSEELQMLLNKQNAPIDLVVHTEFSNYASEGEHNRFKDLTYEIVRRIPKHNEYSGLYKDVLSTFFNARNFFLKIYISQNYSDTDKNNEHDDLSQLCQRKISFFKNIAEKEFKLFKSFFWLADVSGNKAFSFIVNEFDTFLRNVLDPLYDDIRLLVLKETNINNLCNLTTLLQKYYEFEDNLQAMRDGDLVYFEAINYGELFQEILADVQSRLIFRTQLYIDDKLLKYEPTLDDLKLSNKKSVASSTGSITNSKTHALDLEYPNNMFKDVYYPLGKALTLLSSIYELINSVVFDDLAHYVVHSCITLLKGEFYKKSLTSLGPIDTSLNYFKNLMILNEHLNNFDIQYVRNEVTIDFTGGFNDMWTIIKNGEVETSGGIIELMKRSIPKIVNNMIDAKQEVQSEMAKAYTEFRTICTDDIAEPIQLSQKDVTIKPLLKFTEFKENLTSKTPNIFKKVKSCIEDEATAVSIMKNILTQISIYYHEFYSHVMENHNDESEPLVGIITLGELETFTSELLDSFIEGNNPAIFKEDIFENE